MGIRFQLPVHLGLRDSLLPCHASHPRRSLPPEEWEARYRLPVQLVSPLFDFRLTSDHVTSGRCPRDPTSRSLPPEEGMSGRFPGAVVVALASARVGIAARSGRHRFDAFEVDEKVNGADDGRQRRDDDEDEDGHRHGRRRGGRRRCRGGGVGHRRSGRHEPSCKSPQRLCIRMVVSFDPWSVSE